MLSDLWCLDMRTPENPDGELSMKQLHTALVDVRQWQFAAHDPATQWNHRRRAQEGATLLTESTTTIVESIWRENHNLSWRDKFWLTKFLPFGVKPRRDLSQEGSLRWYGRYVVSELLKAGKSVQEVSDLCWCNAVNGTAMTVGMVSYT